MVRAAPHSAFLEALHERVLIFDGAMGTSLHALRPTPEDFGGAATEGWMDGLALNAPHLVETVHRSFLDAGCDIVETCTFQATRLRLREWGAADRVHELNRAAASLARRVCDKYAARDHRPRFVAGSIGPTGFLPASSDPTLSGITFGELVDAFCEQARGLVEGGCDLLIIETAQDILEVKAAIFGARRAFADCERRLPLQVCVSLDVSERMLLGTEIDAVLTILEGLQVDVVGLNCSTGPDYMRQPVRWLTENARVPIACIPNAGIPANVDGEPVYPLGPEAMAADLVRFVEQLGCEAVGGCCGSTPEHIRLLAEAVGGRAHRSRSVSPRPRIASAMRATELQQVPAPLLVGERVNAQGSRAVKKLLLADDYPGLVRIARGQVDGGAHALDVCVALTERADEVEQMRATVRALQMSVEAPLVFDSTDAATLQAALEAYPGRPVVNSVNLENGRARCEAVLPLVRDHGACVVALTIDEQGMATTAARKVEIAQRVAAIACDEYGLSRDQLIFDALTFTLATGDEQWVESARETIEGIRAIKEALPGVLTLLGVSNVSFGLSAAARAVLNSVFLHHCVAAGLDAAIINPAQITPYPDVDSAACELADDLIFHRREDALARYIAHFEGAAAPLATQSADRFEGLAPAERIHQQILQRHPDGIEEQIDLALRDRDPVAVLNEILLPAMKEVGDRFGAGELILPFVLQSAEVMKRAVAHVEQFLERREGYTKGTVVLATVYGDVHDIGKNLVNTILSNNGYTVHDLGKQVPLATIIDKAVEVEADVIGLSALLVSTSRQMPLCVQELDSRGLRFPLLIGGAAINRPFGRRILWVEDDRPFEPGVFYCKDAFEGLATVDQLLDEGQRDALIERIRSEAQRHRDFEQAKREAAVASSPSNGHPPAAVRSDTRTDAPIPVPPFWGARTVRDIAVDDVVPHIDRTSLFKMSWQFRGIRDPQQWEELLRTELEPRLQRSIEEGRSEGWLQLQAVYGYWPALADSDSIIVFDPTDIEREIARFHFPRQSAQNRLCLADYVRPSDQAAPGERDVIALQLVTTGPGASERSAELQREGRYDDMLRVHGFATQMAEATAEWVHQRIRGELSLPGDQGRRYSWGYPACPDLDEHVTFFSIVPAQEIGVSLTEGHQLVPEQSTAAIVLHHPQARYFAVYGGVSDREEISAPG